MKTTKIAMGLLVTGFFLLNPCLSQNNDSIIAYKAYHMLKRAGTVNGITIGFGVASNVEMIAIGGFPLEVDGGLNPGLNLTHMCLGIGRITTSLFPPIRVSKARKMLEPWRDSPEMAASCTKLFANLDAAQVMTAIAPVLCITGGAMMFAASLSSDYTYEYNNSTGNYEYISKKGDGLKTAGWVLVGAGLAASVSSQILINISKRELVSKMGSLRMTAGATGIGMQYNLPVQH
jgi:hypothetical protein